MVRIMFAGGGTGGHVFPAIAIADAVVKIEPRAEILFVGTRGKIEERVVPKAGYKFKSIWISGFIRAFDMRNLLFPLKLIISLIQSFILIKKFKPDVVVGTGGYVSGPVVFIASLLGIPTLIHEQNSYPGATTRFLARFVDEIHLSFEVAKKYLKSKAKVFVSGNPVRSSLKIYPREEAVRYFGLDPEKRTLFVFGGSSGARSINEAMLEIFNEIIEKGIQIIWQTGALDYDRIKSACEGKSGIKIFKFIDEIDRAYSACDLVLCRAGATTIAEVTYFGVPAILVPYPFATANHQFENARVLFESGGSEILLDAELKVKLREKIFNLIEDKEKLEQMRQKVSSFANPEAGVKIARSVLKLAGRDDV